jgi:hypothetical protein
MLSGRDDIDDIHKGISQTHHCNNKNIHTQGKADNKHIKMRQPLVLCKAMYNEIHANDVYEVEIQTPIDDEVNGFFASIPPLVDVDISF